MDAVVNCIRNAGGIIDHHDLGQQLRGAYQYIGKGNAGNIELPQQPKWPAKDYVRIQEIARHGSKLSDFTALSPVSLSNEIRHTETIIDALFPGDPLLCCGWAQDRFDTRCRSEWRGGLAAMPLIVPSPMRALTGRRKRDGKESAHSLDNTGSRRFLVRLQGKRQV